MIATVGVALLHAAASPPKPLRPIIEEFFFIPIILDLKLALQTILFLEDDVAPAYVGAGECPSDELEACFMVAAIIALAMSPVPCRFARVLMVGPMDDLTIGTAVSTHPTTCASSKGSEYGILCGFSARRAFVICAGGHFFDWTEDGSWVKRKKALEHVTW